MKFHTYLTEVYKLKRNGKRIRSACNMFFFTYERVKLVIQSVTPGFLLNVVTVNLRKESRQVITTDLKPNTDIVLQQNFFTTVCKDKAMFLEITGTLLVYKTII
jgi:hypothetical protein